jgi:hypothetical protein
VTTLTLGRLRVTGEAFLRELSHARFLEITGGAGPSRSAITDRYAFDLGPEAMDIVLDLADGAVEGSDDDRSARTLVRWLTTLALGRALAPIDETIDDWRTRSVVRPGDGRAVSFDDVDSEIARLSDRGARIHLDRARAALAALDLTPLLAERVQRERAAVESLGVAPSMLATVERFAGGSLAHPTGDATSVLAASAAAWNDTLSETLRKRFGLSLREARQADLVAALDLSRFDAVFRIGGRDAELRAILGSIGLRPDLGGRLRIERTQRGGPVTGAEVVPIELPSDVRLILGAVGGVATHRLALDGLAMALRRAHAEPDAPFEHRWLADRAIEVAMGHVLGSLLFDEPWLMRLASLSRSEARSLARAAALCALHDLRYACALHLYHVRTLEADLSEGAMEELYLDLVTGAIGIVPNSFEAALHAPRVPEVGTRMRGWQASGVLAEELVQRFDVDWYRNPRTGPWLVQSMLAPAAGEIAGELIARATGRKATAAPWTARLERVVAA